MDTYMVTLADQSGGNQQRVLVEDRNPDRDWQEWIDGAWESFNPPLMIANPKVMRVRKLAVKHAPRGTVMPLARA